MRRAPTIAIALAALLSIGAMGCAAVPARPAAPKSVVARLIAEGRREGLPLVDPLALDAGTLADAARVIPGKATPELRLRALLSFLNDEGYVHFQYPELATTPE